MYIHYSSVQIYANPSQCVKIKDTERKNEKNKFNAHISKMMTL